MNIKNIGLGWISVSNLKKSKAFFTDVVGLKFSSGADEYGWIELQGSEGGCMLGMGEHGAGDCDSPPEMTVMPGQNAVLTLTVDNITAAKADMEKKGVVFVGDIVEVPGHVKMALFTDPDGNKFQLVEVLSEKK